jgi:UPF0755 protein
MNSPRSARLLSLLIPAILLLVMLGVSACGQASELMLDAYLEDHQAELTSTGADGQRPVRFVVEPGTPAKVIGKDLLAAGLISDDLLFEAYVRVNGLATKLEAGTFILSPSMSMVQIVEELQNALARGTVVAIPEGWRLEQTSDFLAIADIFSDTVGAVSPQAEYYKQIGLFGDLSAIDTTPYEFLFSRPPGTSLEGYMFPDTYEIDADDPTAAALAQRQFDRFKEKVLPLYEQAVAEGATQLTLHEVLTLASIIEREAVVPEERPTIAGVYANRIADGMRLEADPTVQYAMGYQPDTGQWWKTPVTLEEYSSVESPYNTYLSAGLPPGPIANPGLSSIEAALRPEKHDYYFFVAVPDGTGRHVFAATFDEHIANVQRYSNGQ